jgi:beta-phosphoglucomutase family hydrolase
VAANKPPVAAAHAVLFDLDGVIVDSRAFHMQAWEQWAREHNITHESGYFHSVFGMRNHAIIRGLLPGVSPEHLVSLADHKEQLFRAAARGNLQPLPGVIRLLDLLDARQIPRAIVTSTPRANLDVVLTSLMIEGRFGALVAEEDATKGKPDPEGFLVAAGRLQVAPARCVVIEDAPAGLEAARAAGMRAIGVTTTHPRTALGKASIVVDSLADGIVSAFILS